jgi:hypothetical protein
VTLKEGRKEIPSSVGRKEGRKEGRKGGAQEKIAGGDDNDSNSERKHRTASSVIVLETKCSSQGRDSPNS